MTLTWAKILAWVGLFDATYSLWSIMDSTTFAPSPQLEEANQRLLALRAQAQAARRAAGFPAVSICPNGRVHRDGVVPWETPVSQPVNHKEIVATLPAHLGWGCTAATAILRRGEASVTGNRVEVVLQTGDALTAVPAPIPGVDSRTPSQETLGQPGVEWVKLYPDIGLGMLREEMAAPGRLWLMLRYLDTEGRGSLRIDNLREKLTHKTSNLRLCGWRQLRNLLRQGEGVYWTRDKTYVWLHSAARVAVALGVEQVTGRPVALPSAALLDGMGTFRAHLYAAFHSGRTKETPQGDRVMPIARETLEQLSGVGRSSQRVYEAQVGLHVQANFVVGGSSTKEAMEKRAWAKGQALFELKDYRGQQGKKGKIYLAWQLPNSYSRQHRHRPRGRQKRINRKLKDLVMKGMPGNMGKTSESHQPEKIYFPNGKLAAKAYGRDPDRELYWQRHVTENGRFDVWHQLGG